MPNYVHTKLWRRSNMIVAKQVTPSTSALMDLAANECSPYCKTPMVGWILAIFDLVHVPEGSWFSLTATSAKPPSPGSIRPFNLPHLLVDRPPLQRPARPHRDSWPNTRALPCYPRLSTSHSGRNICRGHSPAANDEIGAPGPRRGEDIRQSSRTAWPYARHFLLCSKSDQWPPR